MHKVVMLVLAILSFPVSAAEQGQVIDCSHSRDVKTTIDMNACLSHNSAIAEAKMNLYLKASLKHNAYDPEVVKSIKIAQKDWNKYKSSNCDSVYIQWREGTIRDAMSISCHTRLIKQRTHELWENYLTYMDSTPPVLPEPN